MNKETTRKVPVVVWDASCYASSWKGAIVGAAFAH